MKIRYYTRKNRALPMQQNKVNDGIKVGTILSIAIFVVLAFVVSMIESCTIYKTYPVTVQVAKEQTFNPSSEAINIDTARCNHNNYMETLVGCIPPSPTCNICTCMVCGKSWSCY